MAGNRTARVAGAAGGRMRPSSAGVSGGKACVSGPLWPETGQREKGTEEITDIYSSACFLLGALCVSSRPICKGTVYMVTRRCTQRQFLLRPDEVTNQTFLFCLAYAAQKTGVRVLYSLVMSNPICSV